MRRGQGQCALGTASRIDIWQGLQLADPLGPSAIRGGDAQGQYRGHQVFHRGSRIWTHISFEVRDRVVPQDPRSQGLKVASRYSSNNSDHKLQGQRPKVAARYTSNSSDHKRQGQSPKVASRYNSNSSDAGPPNKPSLHEMEACLLNNCCFDDLPDVDVFGLLGHHSAKKLVQESQVIRDYFNYNLKVTRGDVQEMKGHTIVEGDAVLRELFKDFRYVTPPATAENETAEGVTP